MFFSADLERKQKIFRFETVWLSDLGLSKVVWASWSNKEFNCDGAIFDFFSQVLS